MNSLTRIMSYDKTKIKNQENCNCEECVNIGVKNQTVEYSSLSEEEIDKIINEQYDYKDEKTKKFIRKALRKHGDRYDYSNVIYIKSDVKVEIICRVKTHKPFSQTPHQHISRGQGCPYCSGKHQYTTEEFIEESNKVHGVGRYDYSKVNYKNINTKVIIICHNHEEPYEFKQTPNNHLQGHGCKKCQYEKISINQKMTLEEFIEQSRKIHGDKYDYSKVNYVDSQTKVIIICPKHSDFKQKPNHHLRGEGCRKCALEQQSIRQTLTLEEFIEQSRKIHGDKYDYSKVKYISGDIEVIITCPKHGDFPQTPNAHSRGQGCPKCNSSKGEVVVRNWLIKNKIEFEEQKRFDDCRDKRKLPFDFYLPQYNLCIEYDGEQHFNAHSFNCKKESKKQRLENLKKLQSHDQIKNNYCKSHNINLLRIKYDENTEEKLTKWFQNHKLYEN